jgi:hypothetical protein
MHNLWDSNITSVLCDPAQAFFVFKELECRCLDFLLTVNNDVWDMIHLELTWRSCEKVASYPEHRHMAGRQASTAILGRLWRSSIAQ